MMTLGDPERIPVLIGVGEMCDRPAVEVEGMDSIELMLAALRAAEIDAGAVVLDGLDWLGVEDQISFPMPAPQEALADQLPTRPAHLAKTRGPSGDGPLQLINDAANLIGRGEIRLGATAGGEALRTAAKRAQADLAAGRAPPKSSITDVASGSALPLARKYGLLTPVDVYPLYENATRAAWGQTLAEGQAETGAIWAAFSEVAATNPNAWMRKPMSAEQIAEPTADNRMISFPYTKLMVANASVNMGAAVIIASLAMARELGVPEERLVYIGAGAAAHESGDFLKRDTYARSASLETTVAEALARNDVTTDDLDHVELYSCFPCIPKMARRALGWPLDRPASVYGGLTFGGGPIGNCMMHAVARMVHRLREGAADADGLIVANGGYATYSHSMVFTRRPPPAGTFPQDYSVQQVADARRSARPDLLDEHEGEGTVETYTVAYDRHGAPRGATVIARDAEGRRFLASVSASDTATLDALIGGGFEPVGRRGTASRQGDIVVWTMTA